MPSLLLNTIEEHEYKYYHNQIYFKATWWQFLIIKFKLKYTNFN